MSYVKNVARAARHFGKSLLSLESSGLAGSGAQFFEYTANGETFSIDLYNTGDLKRAYEKCPPVASILHKEAQALINSNVFVMNSKGKEAEGTEATKIRKLFKKPNPIQSWKQFEAQYDILTTLYGYCPILAVKPEGYTSAVDASALWVLPPWVFSWQETGKLYFQSELGNIISGMTVSGMDSKSIKPEDVIIMRDWGINYKTQFVPQSRLKPMEDVICMIVGAIEANNKMINQRGALGILSNVGQKNGLPLPLKDDEKKTLQEDFKRYGLQKDQWNIIITTASLMWQSMSVPVQDLMLHESIKAGTEMLADCLGYPSDLLAGSDRKTFNNVDEAKKALYQDTIIPKALSYYEQWNQFFQTDKLSVKIEVDFSHIEALQKSAKDKADAAYALNQALQLELDNNIITPDDWREQRGYDRLNKAPFNQYRYENAPDTTNQDQSNGNDNNAGQ